MGKMIEIDADDLRAWRKKLATEDSDAAAEIHDAITDALASEGEDLD